MSRIAGWELVLLEGGLGSEREVSLETGAAMHAALRRLGAEVTVIDATPAGLRELVQREPRCVVLALHGGAGEDGRVQGLLDALRIPYTGAGVLGSALAMDKSRSKRILSSHGVPTPRWIELPAGGADTPPFLPCVVKPACDGSSVGVHLVRDAAQWPAAASGAAQRLLVEELIEGRELTAAVLGDRLLGVLEIRTVSGRYDYEAKYQRSDNTYTVLDPGDAVDGAMVRQVGEFARVAYAALALRGVARMDVLVDARGPWFLEANTLPGMTSNSLVPKIAKEIGWDFDRLVEEIVLAARCDG